MSNIDRPRTGLKACPFDGATERDSNGQCHCRNVLYRMKAAARRNGADDKKIDSASKKFDSALKNGGSLDDAVDVAKKVLPAPAKKAAAKKPAAKKPAAKKASTKKAPSIAEAVQEAEAEEAVERPADEWSDEDLLGEEPAVEEPATEEPEGVVSVDNSTVVPAEVAEDAPSEPALPPAAEPGHVAIPNADETGWVCSCGFAGKGSLHSIRAHISRA